jgi:hypothetical protein
VTAATIAADGGPRYDVHYSSPIIALAALDGVVVFETSTGARGGA